jgi:hypothetical protein
MAACGWVVSAFQRPSPTPRSPLLTSLQRSSGRISLRWATCCWWWHVWGGGWHPPSTTSRRTSAASFAMQWQGCSQRPKVRACIAHACACHTYLAQRGPPTRLDLAGRPPLCTLPRPRPCPGRSQKRAALHPPCFAGHGFASWRALLTAVSDHALDELDSSDMQCDVSGRPWVPCLPACLLLQATCSVYVWGGRAGEGKALARAAASDIHPAPSPSPSPSQMLMGELQKESENGRLLRLLVQLGMVVDRAELGGDAQWAETGDRYLLKLFRDFLLHQVGEMRGCL